jgi:hypothetical protein
MSMPMSDELGLVMSCVPFGSVRVYAGVCVDV